MKYFHYLLNILKSYVYDIFLWLFEDFKSRARFGSLSSYRAYKAYPGYLKYGAALDGVRYLAEKYCSGNGVDVGAGIWPLKNARPVEDNDDENAYNLKDDDGSLDYVFTSHVLEHLERPFEALQEWSRVLKKNGILFLYLPHPSCRMWAPENLSSHVWMPDPLTLEKYFIDTHDLQVEDMSYTPDGMMSYYIIARKMS